MKYNKTDALTDLCQYMELSNKWKMNIDFIREYGNDELDTLLYCVDMICWNPKYFTPYIIKDAFSIRKILCETFFKNHDLL